MTQEQQNFLNRIGPMATADMKRSGILASLTIAQAILESGWGKSTLTVKANNLFGIKGQYNGASETVDTKEWDGKKFVTVKAAFRKYPSWAECVADHSNLFLTKAWYANLRGCTDYKLACRYVWEDGYATDPGYTAKLVQLIEQYGLTGYDTVQENTGGNMKYNDKNKPLVCMQTQSTCYKGTRRMEVKGVLWHSTGANNPWLKRYVQPSENDPNFADLKDTIGWNSNRNDWNHIKIDAGLNCWIGKLANGTVATVQTMPWDYRPWGCGSGKLGSCNSGWIQFEIAEGDLNDPDYFAKVYREACEITAYLCKLYGIDPHGSVTVSGVAIPTILCHADSHKLGFGSNHGDIYNWFQKHGKDMNNVRDDVAALLKGQNTAAVMVPPTNMETEDDDMDVKRFKELYSEMRKELQDNDAGEWSAAARQWAIDIGLISGNGATVNGQPNYMWADTLTREQLVTVLFRFAQLMGKA